MDIDLASIAIDIMLEMFWDYKIIMFACAVYSLCGVEANSGNFGKQLATVG